MFISSILLYFILFLLFLSNAGNSTATARDPARSGSTFGPLEVIADLKEPVSALKARMIKKAAEMTYIVEDDQERYVVS